MLKSAFFVSIVWVASVATMHHGPAVADSDPLFAFKVAAKAAVDAAKAGFEFVDQATNDAKKVVTKAMLENTVQVLLQTYLVSVASYDVLDPVVGMGMSPQQLRGVHVTAKTTVALRQRLDTMEAAETVFDAAAAEVVAVVSHLKPEDVMKLALKKEHVEALCETLRKRFEADPRLRSVYESVDEQMEKSTPAAATAPPKPASKTDRFFDAEGMAFFRAIGRLFGDWERVPVEVRSRILRSLTANIFLHHAFNRLTLFKREYFALARSTLKLSQQPRKLAEVQRVFDEALADTMPEVADADMGGLFVALKLADVFFTKLQRRFETYPALNEELRKLKPEVSNSRQWDTSVWDLDLAFV